MMRYKCDIILPVCDQYEFTKKCIESIIKHTDTPYRLIIINNGRNPDTRKLLDELERKKNVETTIVHNARNIGWVKALNNGIELSDAPFVCFQNDDTVVTRGWLRKMIDILNMQRNFGMINPSWEGRPQHVSIDRYNSVLERKKRKRFMETDWCRGFSVVIKRDVIDRIGKVDEIYGLAYFDDVDYSVTAIEAGFLCLKALDTYVYHHRNVTFFEVLKGPKWNELHEKNKRIYYKKWGRPLKISVLLDSAYIKDDESLKRIIEALYYLARKQHRIYLWSSDKRVKNKLFHTNIIVRTYPYFLLTKMARIDLLLNARKNRGKRYDAVFIENKGIEDFDNFIKQKVDILKEKTKGEIDVSV